MSQESAAKTSEARQRLPLKRLLEQRSFGPSGQGESWKGFKCPFCAKKKATVFPVRGASDVEVFKCWSASCPSGTAGKGESLDEGKFLAKLLGCSEKEGWLTWLKEAGVYQERERHAPSVLPGQRARRNKPPEYAPDGNDKGTKAPSPLPSPAGGEGDIQPLPSPAGGEGEDSKKDLAEEAVSSGSNTNGVSAEKTPGVEEPHNKGSSTLGASNPQETTAENEPGAVSAANGSSQESSTPDPLTPRPSPQGEGSEGAEGAGRFISEFEQLLIEASEACIGSSSEGMMCSKAFLQRRFGVSDSRAYEILKAFEERGLIGPAGGDGLHRLKIVSKLTARLALEIGRASPQEEGLVTSSPTGEGGGNGGGDEPPGDEDGSAASGDSGGGLPRNRKSDEELALMALREFYSLLHWRPEDEEAMWVNRGILPATCRLAGLRSSGPESEAILRGLADKYGNSIMIRAGLYKIDTDEESGVARARPERQFCGWGVIGKRKNDKGTNDERNDKSSELEWGQCNPILIPYFDVLGELVGLRPHKGNPKGGQARLYVVRAAGLPALMTNGQNPNDKARQPRRVIVCEGEFKALAVWQVFRGEGQDVEACAAPGISMTRNAGIQYSMRDFLRGTRAKEVLVGFDSEEKGDPKLESFKEDPWKRHDTEAYARFFAGWLKAQGTLAPKAGVVFLPKAWRDAKGKADWDGVLSRMLKGELAIDASTPSPRPSPTRGAREKGPRPSPTRGEGEFPSTLGGLEMVVEFWNQRRGAIRKAWAEVLKDAVGPNDYASGEFVDQEEMFYGTPGGALPAKMEFEGDEEGERIVKNKLERWRLEDHGRRLPFGDDAELALKRKFMKLAFQEKDAAGELTSWQDRAKFLATKFGEVLGWYYIRSVKVKPGKEELMELAAGKAFARRVTEKTGHADWETFFEEWEKGIPKGVADFKMDCKFLLVKSSGDTVRMVILRNSIDKTTLVELDSRSFTSSRDFREWCCNKGNFAWMTGDTELQALLHDISRLAAFLRVYELGWYGWHEESKLWLYRDCAITPAGAFLKPDPQGIIWWRGMGYMMGEKDVEGEEFKLGRPRMQPDIGLRSDLNEKDQVVYRLEAGEDDADTVMGLFQDLTLKLEETQAGLGRANAWEGSLILGSVLAYCAAPEFFKSENWFASLWLHGERGGGKSSLARWLSYIHGTAVGEGIKLPDSTGPGLKIVMQQYSNIPVWLEEAKRDLDPMKAEFLKSPYNREVSAKKEFGGKSRRIRTNPIVTGEVTSSDSATRQRYIHAQVSRTKRVAEHFDWMQENKDFFLYWRGRFCVGASNSWSGFGFITGRGTTSPRCARASRARAGCMGWVTRDGGRRRTSLAGSAKGSTTRRKALPHG